MASRGPFVDLGSWGRGFIAGIAFLMVVCLVTFTIKMSHYFSRKISVSQDLDPEGHTLDWTVLEIRVGDCFHFYSLALLKIKNDRKPGYRKAMSQWVGVLCCFLLNVMRTRAPRQWWLTVGQLFRMIRSEETGTRSSQTFIVSPAEIATPGPRNNLLLWWFCCSEDYVTQA